MRQILLALSAVAAATKPSEKADFRKPSREGQKPWDLFGILGWWNIGPGIGCPFDEPSDASWTLKGGDHRDCAWLQRADPDKRRLFCGKRGASGVPAAEACPHACLTCCDGAALVGGGAPDAACAAVAREFSDAAKAAARLDSFCDDPPARGRATTTRTFMTGPRFIQGSCFGRFQEAHLSVNATAMQRECCDPKLIRERIRAGHRRDRNPKSADPEPYLVFPRSQVEAARFYASTSTRDVDVNFLGRLHLGAPVALLEYAQRAWGDYVALDFSGHVAASMRRWVLPFVERYFTAESVLVDTSAEDAATYAPLGAFDKTVAGGKLAGFRPMTVEWVSAFGNRSVQTCRKATCDPSYYETLARSRFTLAPAGDMPWSTRFFEAIMAGSVPVVSSEDHAGRNAEEKALGYKYLLVSEYVARRTRFPGAVPYCDKWAAHNLAIFLERQSYIADPSTVRPNVDRCLAEADMP